ncbi:MAG: radical SAM protein, partial [Bacteroidota bacterium]
MQSLVQQQVQTCGEAEYRELLREVTGRAVASLAAGHLQGQEADPPGRHRPGTRRPATATTAAATGIGIAVGVGAGVGVGPGEITALLTPPTPGAEQALFAAADRVRQMAVGDAVNLRAIIEFSNHCERGCWYCGLRRFNRRLPRYRMTVDEVVEAARSAIALGFRTVVLQSGEDSWYDEQTLCSMIRRIKSIPLPSSDRVAITLSLGERPRAEYAAFR